MQSPLSAFSRADRRLGSHQANPALLEFEPRLLRWLQDVVCVEGLSLVDAGTARWRFQYGGHWIDLSLVDPSQPVVVVPSRFATVASHGKPSKKKSVVLPRTDPSWQAEWLLRIEEPEPLAFLPLVAACFSSPDRHRKMAHGRVRSQFLSHELLADSPLATP